MKRREGFTLVELLIVVVIIGILVSISIPIFTAQMHKAKVAADWANLRAYYAEIQADYMSTQQWKWGSSTWTSSTASPSAAIRP